MSSSLQPLEFTEHAVTEIAQDAVDETVGVIKHVKILGKISKNRRRYTQQAMEQAAKLYDGIDVHIDHAKKPGDPRSLSESVGVLGNISIEEPGIFGDLFYLKMHPYSGAVVERARRFPKNFGLSHDASGNGKRGKDGWVTVESVDHVNSVDIVLRPATNTGLFESETPRMPTTLKQVADSHSSDPRAKRLAKLLESTTELAAETVDIPAEMGAADQVTASISAAAGAIVVDQSISDADKVAKIAELLGVPGGTAEETATPVPTPAAESVLAQQVAAIANLLELREACEAGGMVYGCLTAAQKKQLADTAPDARAGLVESWSKSATPAKHKPAIGPKAAAGAPTDTYEHLVEQAKRRTTRSGMRV